MKRRETVMVHKETIKFVTLEEAVQAVRDGDWVDYGFGAGFPAGRRGGMQSEPFQLLSGEHQPDEQYDQLQRRGRGGEVDLMGLK